ncbi:MAG: carboxypeptidase-like regulatory domain-containing protein, partial [Bacteroidota bacterium]
MPKQLSFLLVALMLATFQIVAQETGTLSGTIIDAQTKQPIPLVNITLRTTPYGAASDSAGQFEIPRV